MQNNSDTEALKALELIQMTSLINWTVYSTEKLFSFLL